MNSNQYSFANSQLLKKNQGLTLIELILVMAILAILAASLWSNFFSSIAKGRDSRRKQDLQMVAKALELYYYDQNTYPLALNFGQIFTNPDDPSVVYMEMLPADPSFPTQNYCYESTDGTYYKIYADFENVNDPDIFDVEVECNGQFYNYGISSPNTNPEPTP